MNFAKEGRDSKDNLAYKMQNGLTFKWDHDVWSTKTKLANDKISFDATVKPKDLNKDDLVFSAKHASSLVPSCGAFETTQAFKLGTPELGPMRLWLTVRLYYKSKDSSATIFSNSAQEIRNHTS